MECNAEKHLDTYSKNCGIIKRYCKRYESYLSGFVREARRLDRLSNVRNGNHSIEEDALEILGSGGER